MYSFSVCFFIYFACLSRSRSFMLTEELGVLHFPHICFDAAEHLQRKPFSTIFLAAEGFRSEFEMLQQVRDLTRNLAQELGGNFTLE